MVRIWAKIMSDEKIVKDYLLECDETYSIVNFISYLEQVCYHLDIPNPITLRTHIKNYYEFHNVKYRPDDFVEQVTFDYLILESATD